MPAPESKEPSMDVSRNRDENSQPLLPTDWTALDVDDDATDSDQNISRFVKPKKNHTRVVDLTTSPCPLFPGLSGHIVFPTGIFYKSIRNPNDFDIQIIFSIASECSTSLCISPMTTCHDVTVLSSPLSNSPRGQRWSERFGIITRDLLDQGIVERRSNGDVVAWRKFRTSQSQLTPFGIWSDDKGNSMYTVMKKSEYTELQKACLAFEAQEVTVHVIPLFSGIAVNVRRPVELEYRFPYLYSGILSAKPIGEDRV